MSKIHSGNENKEESTAARLTCFDIQSNSQHNRYNQKG